LGSLWGDDAHRIRSFEGYPIIGFTGQGRLSVLTVPACSLYSGVLETQHFI
jgi:uncharacterized protein YlaN (UPF0358 family)